jgi:hypothetical protein
MSTDTLTERPAPETEQTAPRTVRLGSFMMTGQIVDPEGPDTTFHLAATGAEDSAFAGRAAVVSAMAIPQTADLLAQAEVLLAKRKHLTHPVLVPVLETGNNGTVLFWAEAEPAGKSLESDPAAGPWPISAVKDLIGSLAGGLQIAHDLGLSHGAIDADSVLRAESGGFMLAGLGLGGAGAAQDQADLSVLVIGLLAGRPWVENSGSASRADAIREFLAEQTQLVAAVLARASDPDQTARYASMSDFAGQFGQAVVQSAGDLVHGAFEAVSGKSPELARLLADRAAAYDPANESLKLLNLQLRGGSPFAIRPDPIQAVPGVEPFLQPPVMDGEPFPQLTAAPLIPPSLLPEELTRGLPEEFLRAIAPQFEVKPVTKARLNPMFVMIVGCVGIAFLLALAGLITLMLPNR